MTTNSQSISQFVKNNPVTVFIKQILKVNKPQVPVLPPLKPSLQQSSPPQAGKKIQPFEPGGHLLMIASPRLLMTILKALQ